MKIKVLLLAAILLTGLQVNAQSGRSPFRAGYLRLGFNTLGDDLNYSLSPRQNVFDGRYGAKTGYVVEFGHIYYFKNAVKAGVVNYGLDWTILSLNYNKMDKWNDYAARANVPNAYVDGTKIAAAISSKLGPVISFNPVEKLVIDLRFQIAPTLRFFDLEYSEDDGMDSDDGRYFSFTNYAQGDVDESFNSESFKNRTSFGVATSFGITVRRQAIGLSLDYVSGKANTNYEAYDNLTGSTFGKYKIPIHNLQFKLSLTL